MEAAALPTNWTIEDAPITAGCAVRLTHGTVIFPTPTQEVLLSSTPTTTVVSDPTTQNSDRCWYALTTRPGRERQTARALQTVLGRATPESVVVDVPVEMDANQRTRVRWSGMILIEVPNEGDWVASIRAVPGVIGFVGGIPVALRDDEVEKLRSAEKGIDVSALSPGDPVVVVSGPFSGMSMTITVVDGDRIQGLVNIFGRDTPVTVERAQLSA